RELKLRAASLSVYRGLLSERGVRALTELLDASDAETFSQAAAEYFGILCERSPRALASEYFLGLIMRDANVFSAAAHKGARLADAVTLAAERDLNTLAALAKLVPADFAGYGGAEAGLPVWSTGEASFGIEAISALYKKDGFGDLYGSAAFLWDSDGKKFRAPDAVSRTRLSDLKEFAEEKRLVARNTEAFIAGYPAQNVLLYGDRGTGKSSTVHAILNEYKDGGLRLLELNKNHIPDFPRILKIIADSSFKFIIFIDDLSFNDINESFNALKAALEGSVYDIRNALIYATTNRRHIVRESFSDRDGDVHASDVMQEQLALSDRFGLTVTYMTPDKAEFLRILQGILADRGITAPGDLPGVAERFALAKGGRSPRFARQLADIVESAQKMRIGIDY
ncbi:MAG: ATP-binding protein, partial [Clostridiales bacterium]|nr:ATP-binding protein [Clostridiales bacterium]